MQNLLTLQYMTGSKGVLHFVYYILFSIHLTDTNSKSVRVNIVIVRNCRRKKSKNQSPGTVRLATPLLKFDFCKGHLASFSRKFSCKDHQVPVLCNPILPKKHCLDSHLSSLKHWTCTCRQDTHASSTKECSL